MHMDGTVIGSTVVVAVRVLVEVVFIVATEW